MFKKIINKIVGDPHIRLINNMKPVITAVEQYEQIYQAQTDDELRQHTASFKERLATGESLDGILPEAFALVRIASIRATGMRHYDVQIIGGYLLHQGQVVEMRTGEGKTLVATLPLYLNALSGQGVHLVTVNEYLARRDGGWMGKILHLLGLSVGCIGPQNFSALYDPEYVSPGTQLEDERLVHWRPCTRAEAYGADVTYGISSEFGFDYLRDNLVSNPQDVVQRQLHYAVIDEVDNILIDEARTPLIISGPSGTSGQEYGRFSQYVRGLRRNTAEEEEEPNGDYNLDEKSRSITLTEQGIVKLESRIPEIDTEAGDSLYDPRFFQLTYYADNALKAEYLFHRDHEYVVQNNEVIIVDDFTGRLMPGRRYSDGLHEAIEAKEGVQVQRENVTIATITLQNYFRLYDKLGGMTGTAATDAEEFGQIYDLSVTSLPTNVQYVVDTNAMGLVEQKRKLENADEVYYAYPHQADAPVFFKRTDFPDQVYGTADAKDQAILAEIKHFYEMGRPILVGTTSVEHSEVIDRYLRQEGIQHNVLNAKRNQSEALVVAQAGRKQAVTISTNMAGRGTDILLGGNPEGLAAETLEEELFDRVLMTQLAVRWLTEGEEAARTYAHKHPKLHPSLLDELMKAKEAFDSALAEIEEVQVVGYLARALRDQYSVDFNQALNVLRLVRTNQTRQARELLDGLDKDVAMVDDAIRLTDLYTRYQTAAREPQAQAQFLAEYVFEQHYNGRAALIRAVLSDDLAYAQKVAQEVPGLSPDLITRIQQIKGLADKERQEVWQLGGLHVIGSERHESRRIDNQLRGRAARQGDPGSSRFFLSLEDDLMRRFGGERLKNFMSRTNIPDDMPIESGMLDRLIESSQERIEGYNFDIRKNVVEYDDVMNKQRQAIYNERREILTGAASDLGVKVDTAFANKMAEVAANYLDDYVSFIRAEVDQAIADYSTDATDSVNVNGVIMRLRGLLPEVVNLDRAELAQLRTARLAERISRLAEQNLQEGANLLQFLLAVGRFVPLLPAIPNVGGVLAVRRSGHLEARERMRQDFLQTVEALFNEFLAEQAGAVDRAGIWSHAEEQINYAFSQFKVEGVTGDMLRTQQERFRTQINTALQELLLESISALNSEQMVDALTSYVASQREKWRLQIGDQEYENYQRLLLLSAIDREWRDYLTAMDDLRREIGLEAIAQRDPKVEYKRRSYQMFADMRGNIDTSVAERFFREIAAHQDFIRRQQQAAAARLQLNQSGYEVIQRGKGRGVELRREMPKVGRNDPCPCGSGKKYKQCHMRQDLAAAGGAPAGSSNGQPAQPAAAAPSRKAKRRRR